jgi:transposase
MFSINKTERMRRPVVALLCLGGKRLRKIGVNAGNHAQWLHARERSLKQTHQAALEVVEHTGKGFRVVKHRWQVERTCAWLRNDRRHSQAYEQWTASTEVMI